MLSVSSPAYLSELQGSWGGRTQWECCWRLGQPGPTPLTLSPSPTTEPLLLSHMRPRALNRSPARRRRTSHSARHHLEERGQCVITAVTPLYTCVHTPLVTLVSILNNNSSMYLVGPRHWCTGLHHCYYWHCSSRWKRKSCSVRSQKLSSRRKPS